MTSTISNKLIIDTLITIDDSGMPVPPDIRQLLDKDVRALYNRDTTKDKKRYVQECIVIYYLGDPKSPARQNGLSDKECLKMAIEQAGLPKTYIPDALVIRLIERYYNQNITEAGRVVENILKGIHNINLSIDVVNHLLNEKLNSTVSLDDITTILQLIDGINKRAGEIPSLLKTLEEAKQNLMYEKETETSRGGTTITSSMNAEDYMD